MIRIETWEVGQIRNYLNDGRLVLDPEYQRKPVWKAKTKILFIDSIARKIPSGAITVFEDDSQNFKMYEVIDGRQRLTALQEYVTGKLFIRENIVAAAMRDAEEDETEDSDLATRIAEVEEYSKLKPEEKLGLDDYQFAVYVVTGSRAEAVRAFVRMNSGLYSLKPQEIRNAVFNNTEFLTTGISLSDELTNELCGNEDEPYFVHLGVMTFESFKRMQDIQFCLECMILAIDGPQHRRDDIDKFCDLYRDPKGQALKTMTDGRTFVYKACVQIWELFEGVKLNAHHFSANEHDFYALVGALKQRKLLTKPQMKNHGADLLAVLSEFRRQVANFMQKVRDNEDTGDYATEVAEYAGTLLGGQVNSKTKRTKRIEILVNVINDVVEMVDPNAFSKLQRQLIWAMYPDKNCARCGKTVAYNDYHAGHKKARALGGQSIVVNGQIEHSGCNIQAGAD